jgi:metallo-beta-lactamase family protein
MVTGSLFLVESNGYWIMLDCGLVQGKREEARVLNTDFPVDVKSIDAVALSHAHIDHSGKPSMLVKSDFNNRVYSTSATRDLCSAMLRDSGSLKEADAKCVNKLNAKKRLHKVEPL